MRPPFDIAADLDTPVSALKKLVSFDPVFLLESVEGGERLGRYSFLGLGRAMTVELGAAGWRVNGAPEDGPTQGPGLGAKLRELVGRAPALSPAVAGLPFDGGLVGLFGYDFVRRLEPVGARLGAVGGVIGGGSAAHLVGPRSMLVFDHAHRRVALVHSGPEWERQSLRREIVGALRGAVPEVPSKRGHEPARASLSREQYMELVGRCQGHIRAGDVFQIVPSVRFQGACHTPPVEVYRALRLLNPSPYMYYVDLGQEQVVGSSPEALVKLTAGGEATLRPIAGTRPRGVDESADRALEAELLADAKEAAEHVMLVDLARNDLGRVAVPRTVRVDPFRVIERYSHVMHIVSGVSGRVRPGLGAAELLLATFPAGTVTGAPKVRAMQLIEEMEPTRRGFYSGTVGYIARGGGMDQAIAIRTIAFSDGGYAYQAGAGVVEASVPEMEHNEVLAKVGALEASLRLAEEGL
ncbi:MAG: anthranilate synthase component I [Isosphaera sp.]|nr:anthranilate synthase component I [Isosphaera sp.]